ncbi:MAG TPA: hypothetical protein VIM62_06350, partial [Acidobacteriaceae bacterium]
MQYQWFRKSSLLASLLAISFGAAAQSTSAQDAAAATQDTTPASTEDARIDQLQKKLLELEGEIDALRLARAAHKAESPAQPVTTAADPAPAATPALAAVV